MIPGLEGRHRWNDQLTLNENDVWPRYKVRTISGLHSLGDSEDRRDNAVGRLGEIPRLSRRRGKTVTYEGVTQATSQPELREAESLLRAAFGDQEVEGRMDVGFHPDYSEDAERFFMARAIMVEITDEQGPPHRRSGGWEREFALALRWSDPRYYDAGEIEGDTGSLSPGGGTAPPVIPPFETAPPTAASGSLDIENTGSAQTPPVIDIYGPVTNPVIENLTHELWLRFNGVSLTAAQFLRVDFARRTVLRDGTSDYRGKLDLLGSNWWNPGAPGIRPGEQTLRLSGYNIADPAHASVRFNPAYW